MGTSRESEGRSQVNQGLSQFRADSVVDAIAKSSEDGMASMLSQEVSDVAPRHHLHKKPPKKTIKNIIRLSSPGKLADLSFPDPNVVDEAIAVEADTASRMMEQDKRFRELQIKNELTPQWKRYGESRGLK